MAAAEEVNPKLSESVDAAELKRMNQAGDLKDCIVEGPISYDLAVDQEAAAIKGYHSPVAADADIMVVPNLASGNLLVKALIYSAGAKLAGFVTGAKNSAGCRPAFRGDLSHDSDLKSPNCSKTMSPAVPR